VELKEDQVELKKNEKDLKEKADANEKDLEGIVAVQAVQVAFKKTVAKKRLMRSSRRCQRTQPPR